MKEASEAYDIQWLDEELNKLYAHIKNKIGARKLIQAPSPGLEYALDQIEHIRLDLHDFV